MVSYMRKTKASAEALARSKRKKGYNCSVYKMKNGYGVSVTR